MKIFKNSLLTTLITFLLVIPYSTLTAGHFNLHEARNAIVGPASNDLQVIAITTVGGFSIVMGLYAAYSWLSPKKDAATAANVTSAQNQSCAGLANLIGSVATFIAKTAFVGGTVIGGSALVLNAQVIVQKIAKIRTGIR